MLKGFGGLDVDHGCGRVEERGERKACLTLDLLSSVRIIATGCSQHVPTVGVCALTVCCRHGSEADVVKGRLAAECALLLVVCHAVHVAQFDAQVNISVQLLLLLLVLLLIVVNLFRWMQTIHG